MDCEIIMTSKKEQRQRSLVTRYPGIFTDWSGTSLSGKLRNQITVGNIVRIPLEGISKEGLSNDEMEVTMQWTTFAMYLRIVKRCKKNPRCFVGVCEDPYCGDNWNLPVKNGDERVFSARNVMEIPLNWNGNENLLKSAKFRNSFRALTGVIM